MNNNIQIKIVAPTQNVVGSFDVPADKTLDMILRDRGVGDGAFTYTVNNKPVTRAELAEMQPKAGDKVAAVPQNVAGA